MEDKFKKSKMFPLIDPNEEEKLAKMIELIQFIKDLDILKKDQTVRILLNELVKCPENKIIMNLLAEHLKPYVILKMLKPLIFKVPPD